MDLRYPIGKPEIPDEIQMSKIQEWIAEVEKLPTALRNAVSGLSEDQLDTPYRSEGWTVRQLVHHLADSHLSTYTAFKFALTEENPLLKPIQVNPWAEMNDSKTGNIELPLRMLEGLHGRWVEMMRGMTEQDFSRTFRFPEREARPLSILLAIYSWHGKHHVAHITNLRGRMGW